MMGEVELDLNSSAQAPAPLTGRRILVSRAKEQAGTLACKLRELGAEVYEIPFIEIRPPRSFKSMDESLKLVAEYEWLILTSVNGVHAMFERMEQLNIPRRALAHLNIAAIGPATRAAIEREGLKVAVTPKEYVAESVVESLSDKVRGKRVLLCRAKIARDVIPCELRNLGAFLDVVEAYETVIPTASRIELRRVLRDAGLRPHLITFTSSSTVHNYVALLGIRSGRSHLVEGVLNASIGPVTSDTLRHYELNVDMQAVQYTIPGLIEAIVQHLGTAHAVPAI
jgi:uroporphyrinogen-III synthase